MDEGPEPERDGQRARPGDKTKTSQRVEIHRVDDLLLGHIGQVSYRPVDDEEADIGELNFSRVCDQREFLSQSFAP